MKVLRVIASMNPASGGPCQGIRNSIPELRKLGVETEVVSLDAPDESFIGTDPFVIHALGPSKSPWQYSKLLMPWLQQHLQNFDVVIAHGLWLSTSYITAKAVAAHKKQGKSAPSFYVMPHGMLDPYFQKAETRRIKAVRNWLYWKLLEGPVINTADGVLFTCQAELELARTTFTPYHPKRELNIGYGIPAPPLNSSAMETAFLDRCPGVKGKKFLLFLSRIHEKKGTDLLIDAYARLIASNVSLPLLVIAGPGSETDFGRKLVNQVAGSEELRHRVFFAGMLTGNAKWGAFYTADAFVLPSHQENFGIAVVEGLACSLPVLISKQVNIWKEIQADGAGIITEDSREGVEKMLKEYSNLSETSRQGMGLAARQCYQKYFSIDKAAQKMYDTILSN